MSNVTFRRIHGRIVPIKMSTQDKAKAGGAIGAGAVIGASYGARAASTSMKAQSAAKAAAKHKKTAKFLAHHVGVNAAKEDLIKVAKFKTRAMNYKVKSRSARNTGRFLSGALFTYGANKVLDRTRLKDNETAKDAVSVGAGIAGAGTVEIAAHARKFGIKSALKTAGAEAKIIAKTVAKFAIRKKLRI